MVKVALSAPPMMVREVDPPPGTVSVSTYVRVVITVEADVVSGMLIEAVGPPPLESMTGVMSLTSVIVTVIV